MTIRRCLLVLGLCFLSSCGTAREDQSEQQARIAQRPPRYRLEATRGFQRAYSEYPESLYAVSIHGPNQSVPIPGVFVVNAWELEPRADSLTFALIYDSTGQSLGVLRFRPDASRIDTLPFPVGYSTDWSSIAFSPGGVYVAYVTIGSDTLLYGVVRRVSDGLEVFRTPGISGPEGTDAQVGRADWADSTVCVFLVAGGFNGWVRLRAKLGQRAFIQDTVDPDEHPIHIHPPVDARPPAPSN